MRNCFVYLCDRKHKDGPKRAMFNIPKNPEKFELWRQALPKHRQLQPHDRVCEKHFDPDDILRDWTYQIQGKTNRLLRAKPILRPNAVPCCTDLDEIDDSDREASKKRKTRSEATQNTIVSVELATSVTNEQQITILVEEEEDDFLQVPATQSESNDNEKEAIFEQLYDNIFEVQLPSTLWGAHREPEGNFIAFSRFDWRPDNADRICSSTSLMIDKFLLGRIWYEGKLVHEQKLLLSLAPAPDSENGMVRMQIIEELLDKLEQFLGEASDVENIEKCLKLTVDKATIKISSKESGG